MTDPTAYLGGRCQSRVSTIESPHVKEALELAESHASYFPKCLLQEFPREEGKQAVDRQEIYPPAILG